MVDRPIGESSVEYTQVDVNANDLVLALHPKNNLSLISESISSGFNELQTMAQSLMKVVLGKFSNPPHPTPPLRGPVLYKSLHSV